MGQDYAHADAVVSVEWMAANSGEKGIRVVEVDVDEDAYDEGHIPGAISWDWSRQVYDVVRRDIIPRDRFEALMARFGITNDTTIVLYGDNNNWFATWAFWQLKIYGHEDVRLLNGGRRKWIAEGRPLSTDRPVIKATTYRASRPDFGARAVLAEVQQGIANRSIELVDARSPMEFTGEIFAPPGLPDTCQRSGHIPTAINVPWGFACQEDGTFKSREALDELYRWMGISGTKPVITYCFVGERSSHTWFVLRYLLGIENVANYDASWMEWGNVAGVPVEQGETVC